MSKGKLFKKLVAPVVMAAAVLMSLPHPEQQSIWMRYADTLRPAEELTPSQFAIKHRILHEIYCSERPGPWDATAFPYQGPAMDTVQEAVQTGKRGVVFMKAGQIGGTDAMINALCWLKVYLPGPQLFMTSTEKVAREFGRERFELIINDMEPLRRMRLPSKRGQILVKRFADGKLQLSGGQSVFNLQSTPYRVVGIDELDSLVENLGGEGDPVKLAEVRTDSFGGATMMIAYAHPTVRERGAAKLFFDNSDQRRGFVKHDCGAEFYLQWEHVKVAGEESDPDAYQYICPGCGEILSDAKRVAMVRKMFYRSVLPPEEAKKKAWIGIHASQLYSPGKSLRSFAQRWIECGVGGAVDDNARRVFYNKVLGEPYESKVQRVDLSALRSLVVIKRHAKDPDFYLRGQVPPAVRFLTAGQDSRTTELHYAIWGWGLRRALDKTPALCGWLIDWGCIKRPYSLTFAEAEFHVFDDLIYRRSFPCTMSDRMYQVINGGHDIGYQPTQIPLIRFCRNWPRRAIPVKGASLEATSASRAPYARWGSAMKFKAGENDLQDTTSEALLLNTFILKTDWYGMIEQRIEVPDPLGGGTARKVGRIAFPEDVEDEFLEQSKNEAMARGKRSGEMIWKKTGPNHYADCNTYAHGLALNLDPFQKNQTAEEYASGRGRGIRTPSASTPPAEDPAMG